MNAEEFAKLSTQEKYDHCVKMKAYYQELMNSLNDQLRAKTNEEKAVLASEVTDRVTKEPVLTEAKVP
jgi:hypothetical protein